MKKSFLITIDTEGDNLWARTANPGTKNATFLPRFQALCERHGFKPVYLTDYQMANDAYFCEFAADVLRRGAGEVGMHLHAWSTPGGQPLSADDYRDHPYLINFPDNAMREKIKVMTSLLTEKFGSAPVSHRAGRWAIDARYVALLLEHGYQVDCSVTPRVSWTPLPSFDGALRGADYREFPSEAYFMGADDIRAHASAGLLQVPMTTRVARRKWRDVLRPRVVRTDWLRPNGKNLSEMTSLLDETTGANRDFAEFMLHSSEFMPGGSSVFPNEVSIERLYADLQALFEHVVQLGFVGATLGEYYRMKAGARL